MNRILKMIIQIILFLLVLSLWGFYLAIRPFKITSSVTPMNYNIPFEDISFKTKDNINLAGWFIPSKKPHAKTIILLHGYPADKGDILPSTLFLQKNYNLLYFDFRYLGKSGGHYSTLGKNEILDLKAAIDYLHTRHIDEAGVFGFSLGAAVALMTAPSTPEIKAIVADSSYANLNLMVYNYYSIPLIKYPLGALTRLWALIFLGIDLESVSPALAAEKIKIPVLLIHSKTDRVIPFTNAVLIRKSLSENKNKQIMFLENTEHGEHFEQYSSVIEKFYNNYLH